MIKKILCLGDSFSTGAELTRPDLHAWPILLSKMNDWQVDNLSQNGSSNDRLIRLLFENIDKNYDLIIFSWTTWARFETFDIEKNKPVCLAPRTFEQKGAQWAKEYYGFWYDNFFQYKKMLSQIIQVQSFLKMMSQPYIFSSVFTYYYHTDLDKCQHLLDKIDTTRFLSFPYTLQDIVAGLPIGPGGHPLEEGNEKIAQVTYDFIQKQINHQM